MARPPAAPFGRRGQRGDDRTSPSGPHQLRRVFPRRQSGSPAGPDRVEWARPVARPLEPVRGIRAVGGRDGHDGSVAMWTAPRIIAALGQLAVTVGHTPTIADLVSLPRAMWPSPSRVRTVFGTWNAALAAAGLRPKTAGHSPRRVWSDEEMLQAIQDAAAAGDPGQGPFQEGRRRPWLAAITSRFGSWPVAESLALGMQTQNRAQGCGSESSTGPARSKPQEAYGRCRNHQVTRAAVNQVPWKSVSPPSSCASWPSVK